MSQENLVIWSNGRFMPWGEAKTHPIGQGLHYGLLVFEGIRFYNTDRGPAIFRLQEHLERLFDSANVLRMVQDRRIKCLDASYSSDNLALIIKELIVRNGMSEGYIRPAFFYGGEKIGLDVAKSVIEGVIAVLPWVNPQREFLRVKTSPLRRIDPRSTDVTAKIGGHYVNSFLARLDAAETGFEETILLNGEEFVAEASVENIFALKDGIFYTPRLGTILPGITRATIMVFAGDLGLAVIEDNLEMEFFKRADEVFLCGTAMEILAVGEIDGVRIGKGGRGEITSQFAAMYRNVVEGRIGRYISWLTFANE